MYKRKDIKIIEPNYCPMMTHTGKRCSRRATYWAYGVRTCRQHASVNGTDTMHADAYESVQQEG